MTIFADQPCTRRRSAHKEIGCRAIWRRICFDNLENADGGEKKRAVAVPDTDSGLFAALKALRFWLTQEEHIFSYVIFPHAAFANIAANLPKSRSEFLDVSGVSEVNAAKYVENA